MSEMSASVDVSLGRQGRLVIPAPLRRARSGGRTDRRKTRTVLRRGRTEREPVMAVVLDASTLLAYLREEPGAEVVDRLLADALMASVNWAEVVQKALSAGVDVDGMQADLQALEMRVEPFLPVDDERAGRLWPLTRQQGL